VHYCLLPKIYRQPLKKITYITIITRFLFKAKANAKVLGAMGGKAKAKAVGCKAKATGFKAKAKNFGLKANTKV